MRNLLALVGLSAVMAAPVAQAEVSDQEFNDLKNMLESALERINELEAEQKAAPSTSGSASSTRKSI